MNAFQMLYAHMEVTLNLFGSAFDGVADAPGKGQ